MGCRQVFNMLLEASDTKDPDSFRETEIFRKCQEIGIIPRSEADLEKMNQTPQHSASSRPAYKNQKYTENHEAISEKESLSVNFRIYDMWCPACAWVIEETAKKDPGVVDVSCSFSTDRMRCDYNPVLTSPDQIIRRIESLGYKAFTPGQDAKAGEKTKEFIRFAISAFLTMNVMMLSFSIYSGFFKELSRDTIYKLSWPMLFMAGIVLFYGGRNIYRRALVGITSVGFSMDTLITAGSFTAFIYSTVNLLSGSIHLYYDTSSMLITLVLLGKTLERKAKDEVQEDLENLFSLLPTKVRLCSEGFPNGRYTTAEQLRKGDIFRVEMSEVIPADGVIVEGTGFLDESSLTGEPLPTEKKPGDRIRSGTRVTQGVLKIKALGVGEESTLGQMIQLMEKALREKTPFEGKTEHILQWFVPLILFLALSTGIVCILIGLSFEDAMIRAVTVMVISCPCTLGIAIPMARVAGISLAGRRGVLVRDFSSFERMERVDTFVLDKTGTVTKGEWSLLEIKIMGHLSKERVLALSLSLEKASDHYIAAGINNWARDHGIKSEKIEEIRVFDNGISGYVGAEEVKIGSSVFLKNELEKLDPIYRRDMDEYGPEKSSVYMSFGGILCAIFIFGDQIREGSSRTVQKLNTMGHRIVLISGDGKDTTKAIGRKIGVLECHGERLPHDKAAFIRRLQEEGHRVAMIGDGINDAPALIQSDLAIAVHAGSHLGKEAADMTLMRGDPEQVLDFLVLAKRVNKKVYQNLACSFFYNVISIPVAMSGLLTPLVAVSAMLMSSLSVIGNTLLLVKKGSQ
jgi:heavy metal translocating P-type ATPase